MSERSVAGLAGSYEPGTPGDWSGSPPRTIQEALDRLAAGGGSPTPPPGVVFNPDPPGSRTTSVRSDRSAGQGVIDVGAVGVTQLGSDSGGGAGICFDDYDTCAGGIDNTIGGRAASCGGGESNQCRGDHSVIAGGHGNFCNAAGAGHHSTVGGGENCQMNCSHGTIGGGHNNQIQVSGNTSDGGTIGGGIGNSVHNAIATVNAGTIAGGEGGTVSADHGTIPGGLNNTVSAVGGIASGIEASAIRVGEEAHASGPTTSDAGKFIARRLVMFAAAVPADGAPHQLGFGLNGAQTWNGEDGKAYLLELQCVARGVVAAAPCAATAAISVVARCDGGVLTIPAQTTTAAGDTALRWGGTVPTFTVSSPAGPLLAIALTVPATAAVCNATAVLTVSEVSA